MTFALYSNTLKRQLRRDATLHNVAVKAMQSMSKCVNEEKTSIFLTRGVVWFRSKSLGAVFPVRGQAGVYPSRSAAVPRSLRVRV